MPKLLRVVLLVEDEPAFFAVLFALCCKSCRKFQQRGIEPITRARDFKRRFQVEDWYSNARVPSVLALEHVSQLKRCNRLSGVHLIKIEIALFEIRGQRGFLERNLSDARAPDIWCLYNESVSVREYIAGGEQ